MVEIIPKVEKNRRSTTPLIGKQLIEILTTGMYSDPKMVIREYIQNAVDSIDVAVANGVSKKSACRINILINGQMRSIAIEDNGYGVSNSMVKDVLCSIGSSQKESNKERGFRGIGRLGGLGYCDEVEFETRRSKKEYVALVRWDCRKLRELIANAEVKQDLKRVLRMVVQIEFKKPTSTDPPHYFKVTMRNVHRFHNDELMNVKIIRRYLSQAAPVPYNRKQFPFARKLEKYLSEIDGFKSYDIRVNEEVIYRPYNGYIYIAANRVDEIANVELIEFRGFNHELLGRGWYANTSFCGSFPQRIEMRGVRLRQGNIEVGNEYFLADIFSERRFATWHIGEIHLNYSIKLNARRDGFEHSRNYEKFLEQAHVCGRLLSNLCRQLSRERSSKLEMKTNLQAVESFLKYNVFIDEDHFNQRCSEINNIINKLNLYMKRDGCEAGFRQRVSRVKRKMIDFSSNAKQMYLMDCIDGRSMRNVGRKELLYNICRRLVESNETKETKEDLLIDIYEPYLKRGIRERLENNLSDKKKMKNKRL